MSKEEQSAENFQTPTEFTGLKTGKPKDTAGGLPAIISSLKHVIGEVGLKQGTKSMLSVNQMNGYDCPGCAWPDPDHERSGLGEFCENGAKAVAEEATTRKVDPAFFKKYTIDQLGSKSDYWLGKSGRLTHPMVLKPGQQHYEPISWPDAFQLIAHTLNKLNTPHEAVFYTSGRTSNEAAFLYQLLVRKFGTNNLPDCSNMCHESSGVALSETVGIGKGSVKLDDFYKADLIIISGQNPGTNHPRMLTALQKAKKEGAKVITINPLRETGLVKFKHPQHLSDMLGSATSITDLFLQIKINGDVALIKAMLKLLIAADRESRGKVLDHEFINTNTHGFEALLDDLKNYDVSSLIKQSGVPEDKVMEAVALLKEKKNIIFCWAMGLTQHKNAIDNIREIVNLLLVKGSIGKPGAGTCPVRGHSNVQGDRTMGIWEKPKKAFLDNLQEVFGFDPPREHGMDTVEAISAMANGRAKVFIGLGGNFLSASPDTAYTAKALQNCDLTVQVSTKLNRSHLVTGKTALILPCLGRTERDRQNGVAQFVTVENSTGVVHQSTGNKSPASPDLLSEPRIVAELGKALFSNSTIDWDQMVENYDNIRDYIEKVIPGFEDYNVRVRNPGGFYLPNGAREGVFKTATGKANFTLNRLASHNLKAGEFIMMTIRSHDQFNTTIYGLDDRYRGIYNERRVILMNPDDMRDTGVAANDVVDIKSYFNNVERVAEQFLVVPYEIPTQCVATYFPEANVLVPVDNFADHSHTPASKSIIVTVHKT